MNCSSSESMNFSHSLFRGDPDEPASIPDYGVTYTSFVFAKFIGIFINSTDNFRLVVLKVYLIKALLATYLFFSILIYLKNFHNLKNCISQMFIFFFSYPYFLTAITGVYPPGLATVAAMSSLVILKIFVDQYTISKIMKFLLCINLVISSLIIVSNRFETACCMLLSFLVFIAFGTNEKRFFERLKLVSTPFFIVVSSFMTVIMFSKPFRDLLKMVFSRELKVLAPSMYKDSEFISDFGRSAVSAQAPYTLIDNSVRNVLNDSELEGFFEELFGFAEPYVARIFFGGLIVSFFMPALLIFLNAFINNLRPYINHEKFDGSVRKSQIAPLFILFNLLLIPFVAFTPWFIWYIMPFLLSYLFFADSRFSKEKVLRYLYLTVFITNFLNYVIHNDQLGGIYISGFIARPLLLNTLFALAALTLLFQVPRFIEFYPRK